MGADSLLWNVMQCWWPSVQEYKWYNKAMSAPKCSSNVNQQHLCEKNILKELNMKHQLIWKTWKLSWRNIQGADARLLYDSPQSFNDAGKHLLLSCDYFLLLETEMDVVTNPATPNKNFTLSALTYLVWSDFYAGHQRAGKPCGTSHFCHPGGI